jgi:hypothetical protein
MDSLYFRAMQRTATCRRTPGTRAHIPIAVRQLLLNSRMNAMTKVMPLRESRQPCRVDQNTCTDHCPESQTPSASSSVPIDARRSGSCEGTVADTCRGGAPPQGWRWAIRLRLSPQPCGQGVNRFLVQRALPYRAEKPLAPQYWDASRLSRDESHDHN